MAADCSLKNDRDEDNGKIENVSGFIAKAPQLRTTCLAVLIRARRVRFSTINRSPLAQYAKRHRRLGPGASR
jgi:hypothetical protein